MSVGTAIGFGRRAFRGEAAAGCGVEGSLKRSFHRGVLQFVLFAIFLMAGTASLVMLAIGVLLGNMIRRDTGEGEASFPILPAADFVCWLLIPLSIAGICWACVGMLNRVQPAKTLKIALGGLAAALIGFVVLDQIGRWTPHDPVDTEAEARPILERLVTSRAKSFPDSIRVVDLKQQIRNITIRGPVMTFEGDWTRNIHFDLDNGCGEIASLRAYVGSEGPIELFGWMKTKCRPEPNQAG